MRLPSNGGVSPLMPFFVAGRLGSSWVLTEKHGKKAGCRTFYGPHLGLGPGDYLEFPEDLPAVTIEFAWPVGPEKTQKNCEFAYFNSPSLDNRAAKRNSVPVLG